MLKFSKKKMIDRVTKAGKADMLTEDVIAIMDNLDGCPVDTNCWKRVVYGEPVYWCVGKNGKGDYVSEDDVIYG